MYVVLTVLSILPLFVIGQIVRIHFTEGGDLRTQGTNQARAIETIPAMRGSIVDQSGHILAVNTARYDVALDPTVKGFTSKVRASFFEKLQHLTGTPKATFEQRVRRSPSRQYVRLLRNIDELQKDKIVAWDIPGLLIETHFARRYNYGTLASHILGHVDTDRKGIAGVELAYDGYLMGQDGRRVLQRDRRGRVKAMAAGRVEPPQHGQTVVLTLDLVRQTILEEELAKGIAESGAEWGTAIAMNPHTGAILGMANMPTYNPNRPAASPTEAQRNRAITDRIEPGSTFKLVPAVAALEQGIITLEDSVETGKGWAVFGSRTMKDTHGYGTIPFRTVIAKSSNIGVAKTALKMEPGVFYQYARNLGFGQPTWIDLPGEVSGTLKKPKDWSGTTFPWMSHGYEVDATPMQILTAYAALANGGLLVQPYVVAERRDITGKTVWRARQDSVRRAFKKETARKLLPAFEEVVQEGTATRAKIEGLRIAGKTGTAQVAAGGSYNRRTYRASFAGFFPAEKPEVVLLVVLGKPKTSGYGGVVAAPIFKGVTERWLSTFPKIAEQMMPTDGLPETVEVPLPDVAGKPVTVAAQHLRAAGQRVRANSVIGHERVVEQNPPREALARAGSRVRLTVDPSASDSVQVMPDVRGLSARQAVLWLTQQGVKVTVKGTGTVQRQSTKAGQPLPAEAVLQCI